jgi:uncharacterized membrane protein YfcA
VTFWEAVLVAAAGVWAGAINTVVGSGTLITFPALLGVGLSPISANVSNTLGLFPGSFTGAYGYRRELEGQGRRAAVLSTASATGALSGAVLLLALPPGAFKAIVPALIGIALVLVVFGKRITAWLVARGRGAHEHVSLDLWVVSLLTGVYGGYFGAAQGVLLMAFLGLFLAESLQRQNALKNVLAGVTNLVAAVFFVIVAADKVNWTAAALIAVGSIAGGVIGARIGRRLSPGLLRATIVIVGVAAMVKLLV